MLQWLCSIDSNLWCFYLDWTKDWNTKYSNSAKIILNQVMTSAAVLDEFLGDERQLYVSSMLVGALFACWRRWQYVPYSSMSSLSCT